MLIDGLIHVERRWSSNLKCSTRGLFRLSCNSPGSKWNPSPWLSSTATYRIHNFQEQQISVNDREWFGLQIPRKQSDLENDERVLIAYTVYIALCLRNKRFKQSGSRTEPYLVTSQIFKLLLKTWSECFDLSCTLLWRYFGPIAYTKLFHVLHISAWIALMSRQKCSEIQLFMLEPACGGFPAPFWIGVVLCRTQLICLYVFFFSEYVTF